MITKVREWVLDRDGEMRVMTVFVVTVPGKPTFSTVVPGAARAKEEK